MVPSPHQAKDAITWNPNAQMALSPCVRRRRVSVDWRINTAKQHLVGLSHRRGVCTFGTKKKGANRPPILLHRSSRGSVPETFVDAFHALQLFFAEARHIGVPLIVDGNEVQVLYRNHDMLVRDIKEPADLGNDADNLTFL